MNIITAYACAWLATGVAVSIAVFTTESASPLWALIIPCLISTKSERN